VFNQEMINKINELVNGLNKYTYSSPPNNSLDLYKTVRLLINNLINFIELEEAIEIEEYFRMRKIEIGEREDFEIMALKMIEKLVQKQIYQLNLNLKKAEIETNEV